MEDYGEKGAKGGFSNAFDGIVGAGGNALTQQRRHFPVPGTYVLRVVAVA